MRRVVVNEAIMTVGPQAFMAAEKLPDNIKRRPPCSPNVPNAHVTPHRGQRLRAYSPGHNVILHSRFRAKVNLSNWTCLTPELTRRRDSKHPSLHQASDKTPNRRPHPP